MRGQASRQTGDKKPEQFVPRAGQLVAKSWAAAAVVVVVLVVLVMVLFLACVLACCGPFRCTVTCTSYAAEMCKHSGLTSGHLASN